MNRQQADKSILYRQLGQRVGITGRRISQRGIIARRTIEHIDRLELDAFRVQLKHIQL